MSLSFLQRRVLSNYIEAFISVVGSYTRYFVLLVSIIILEISLVINLFYKGCARLTAETTFLLLGPLRLLYCLSRLILN